MKKQVQKGEVLAMGELNTGLVAKTEKGLEAVLRAAAEKDRKNNDIPEKLAKKLTDYGFIELEIPMRRSVHRRT